MDAFFKQLQALMAVHGVRALALTALDPRTNTARSVKTPGAEQVLRVAVAAQFGFTDAAELQAENAKLKAELEPLRKLLDAQGETGWEG